MPKKEGGQDQTARARPDRSRSPRKASGTPAATGGADQSKAEDAAQPQQSSALTAASATKATEAVPQQGEVPPPCKGGPGQRSRKKGGEIKGRKKPFPDKLPTPKAAVSGPKEVPTPTAARGRVTRPSGSPADLDANHKRRLQLQKQRRQQKATKDSRRTGAAAPALLAEAPRRGEPTHQRRQRRQQKATTHCKVSSDKESQASAEAKDASQPPRPSNPEPSMATVPAETGAADHNKSKDGDLAQARDAAQSTQPSGDVSYEEID